MGTHERCPGRPSAPRTTTCQESVTQDTPADLRTHHSALCVLARRLLAGAGLVLAFWALTALSQAHADVLPPHSSAVPRPVLHAKLPAPATVRSGDHALSRTLGHLTGRTGTGGTKRPVARVLHGARKTVLGTARTSAGLVHATVPASRTPLREHSRDLGLPRAVPLLPATDVIGTANTGVTRVVHRPSSSARGGDTDCDRSEAQPPRSPTPSAVQGPVRTPLTGVRTRISHPEPGEAGDEQVTSPVRMRLTGTIAIVHRRDHLRPGLTIPVPIPAPVSGSGSGSGDSGGKTSSGAGDLPRLCLPVPVLWSLTTEPETTTSRTIADKPPFSPD